MAMVVAINALELRHNDIAEKYGLEKATYVKAKEMLDYGKF